jgi:gliding motility-associated-like protein
MGLKSLRFIKTIILSFVLMLFSKEQVAQSSLYMPGPTNWVSVGDLDVSGNQLTVEALIYYTGASVDIVSKHTNPGDVNYLLRIGVFEITTTSGYANFGGISAAGVSIVPNRMYHLAATYDGAMLKYYVNGCLTGSMAWTGNMIQSNLITAIGNQSSCACEQFTGYIDEVRVWNVARTQAQITANMLNLPTPATQPGLLGYWKFDGTMVNLQGNAAFDGVPMGAPLYQAIPLPYPSTLYESVTSSDPVCTGDNNGVINVSAEGYYTPYEYSLDGITYGTSPVFPGLTAGIYSVYTRPQNNNSCAVSSTITLTDPPVLNPNLTTTNVTCNGANNGTAAVVPSGGDGPTYHQLWSPSLSTATNITNLAPGNYSVTLSDTCKASGPELVTNGHFEDGNTGFSSGYNCCAGGPGNYAVDVDPTFYNAGHAGSGYGGGGNYLIADGSTVAGTSLWCQTITVTPNTSYNLSAFVASNYATATAVVEFDINGTSVGTVNAPPTTFTWSPFSTVWFSGASTTANICILDQNTIGGGNDFGIDNISFKTCASCITTLPFTITEPTALSLTTVQTNVSCNGGNNGSATVTANGATPGYTYSWNTVPVQTTAAATNLTAGSYTVTVTDLNLCTATTSVTITEPPILTAVISSQTNVSCNGGNNGSATVTAGGGASGYAYSWNTAPIQTSATATTLSPATYTVTVTDANTCTATASVTITNPPLLTVNATATPGSICVGSNTTLNAAVAGGTGTSAYSWNNGSIAATQIVSPLNTTSYTITVTDSMGCTATSNATVTVFIPAAINLGNDTSICQGDMITLDAGAGFSSYLWQNGTTLQTQNISVTNNYFVSAIDPNGCTVKDTLVLTINPLPVIGLLDTVRICPGTSTTLNANPGFVSYMWNTGAATPSINVNSIGNNVVVVQDANGCVNRDSTYVKFYPVPTLQFMVSPLQGCGPLKVSTINSSILNGSTVASWSWQIGTNTFNAFSPSVLLSTPGFYDVFLQATTSNGCIVDTLLTNYIEVYPAPQAIISPEALEYDLFDDNINLINASIGAIIYQWSLFSDSISSATDLVYPITVPGQFNFQLLAVNSYGCKDSTKVRITVDPSFAIYFPNAFTPDGNGNDDIYMPKGFGIKDYEMMIFDRWGEMVFHSKDMSIGWNGSYKGGAAVQDVYVYKCKIQDLKGNQHFYQGAITLVQ